MSLLTENIRWVQSITLEGDRLTADDIVLRRDMVAGGRIDMFGVRLSFIVVAALFLVNLIASVTAFLETLQFFQPDYTVFALSLLPLLLLGFGCYRLRPRQHFTVLLRDGSALGVLSRDGNFLTRCLEAFERLWSDPVRAQSSLYVHAAHRSVDFGPPAGGIDVLANASDEEPVALTLPVFDEDEEGEEKDGPVRPGHPPVPAADLDPPDVAPPPLPPLPPEGYDDEADDSVEGLVEPSAEQEVDPDPTDVPEPDAEEEPAGDPPSDEQADDTDPLPPLPPPFPMEAEEEDEAPEDEAPDDEVPAEEGPEDEPEDRPLFGGHPGVPAAAFVDVRSKVEALVRLLRERAPAQGISDAVDVLELMTRRGCDTPVEVRALARSVDLLRERMSAYPTAVDLLNDVDAAGHLKDHPAVQ